MAIDKLQRASTRPDAWIRQSANRLNEVIAWVNGQRFRKVVSANYTVGEYDRYIGVDGSYTITLAVPTDGREVIIKDESGNAAAANITIVGTIDGVSGYTISADYGVIHLVANGSNWFII